MCAGEVGGHRIKAKEEVGAQLIVQAHISCENRVDPILMNIKACDPSDCSLTERLLSAGV